MLVDSHCHLDHFDDPDSVLLQAARAGVGRIVAVSESAESMRAVLELKRQYPEKVLAGLGLHPAWITRVDTEVVSAGLAWLEANLMEADVLGEVGLDYKWAENPEQQILQQEMLTRQLDLAAGYGKPINLHSRRAQRQTMERAVEFRRRTGLNAQLHWFTDSLKLVRICNEEGVYVSVGPMAIHNPQARAVAVAVDRQLLLLETDAPVSIGGVAGHPARLGELAAILGQEMGLTGDEVAALTAANVVRYLGGTP